MKRNLIKILFLMIAVLLICSNFAIADTGTIIATTVRLREEPDSSSTTLMLIGEEKTVEILGEDGDWYEVEYDGVTGYVSKDYISVDGESTSNSTLTNTVNTTVENNTISNEDIIDNDIVDETEVTNVDDSVEETDEIEENIETEDLYSTITLSEDVDIRYIPCFTSSVSNTIGSGSEVTVLMTLNKWAKITDGNVTGWVIRQNI